MYILLLAQLWKIFKFYWSLKEQWKNLSENQLQRMRDKNAEEIKELDQAESELRNKLVN